jgi:hypothetical protein
LPVRPVQLRPKPPEPQKSKVELIKGVQRSSVEF